MMRIDWPRLRCAAPVGGRPFRPAAGGWTTFCLWVVLPLLPLAGCGGGLREPNPADALRAQGSWPGIETAQLREGRARYVRKCSGCHALVLPEAHSPDRWRHELDDMTERAGLEADDRLLIEQYLVTMGDTSGAATAAATPPANERSSHD